MVVNVSLQKESARPQIHTTYTGSANISTSLYCQAQNARNCAFSTKYSANRHAIQDKVKHKF